MLKRRAALALAVLLPGGLAHSQDTPSAGISETWDPASGKSLPGIAVVLAGAQGEGMRVFGGVLVSPVFVVTSVAALERAPTQVMLMAGVGLPAKIELDDPASGLVLLRIEAPQLAKHVVPVGSAAGLKPGQRVWLVGPAVNLGVPRVQTGTVSAVRFADRVFRVETDISLADDRRFLNDPAGSALLDEKGRAVGIAVRKPAEKGGGIVAGDHVRDLLRKAGVPLQ